MLIMLIMIKIICSVRMSKHSPLMVHTCAKAYCHIYARGNKAMLGDFICTGAAQMAWSGDSSTCSTTHLHYGVTPADCRR